MIRIYSVGKSNRIDSAELIESNRIPVLFHLFGRLQSQCQHCVPVGDKTDANRAVL